MVEARKAHAIGFNHVAPADIETTTALAHRLGLDIEIVHRKLPASDAEQISVTLTASQSFEAFGRLLETINPFAFWRKRDDLFGLKRREA
jgi:hypothetical protein